MRVPSYGQLIAAARIEAGITQQQLADDIMVKRETVSRWERDMLKVTPSAAEMHRLCARLPVLVEVQLLWTLGYALSPLVDERGRLRDPDHFRRAKAEENPNLEALTLNALSMSPDYLDALVELSRVLAARRGHQPRPRARSS